MKIASGIRTFDFEDSLVVSVREGENREMHKNHFILLSQPGHCYNCLRHMSYMLTEGQYKRNAEASFIEEINSHQWKQPFLNPSHQTGI